MLVKIIIQKTDRSLLEELTKNRLAVKSANPTVVEDDSCKRFELVGFFNQPNYKLTFELCYVSCVSIITFFWAKRFFEPRDSFEKERTHIGTMFISILVFCTNILLLYTPGPR